MSFQPVIPFGGFAGYAFLKRTMTSQQTALQATPANQRDETYFKEKIGKINSAEDLVSDRRLLRVALTAFGLESDINNKAFIQKVLEGGTLSGDSLANRLSNKQYEKFSAAFGFGDFQVPRGSVAQIVRDSLRDSKVLVAGHEQTHTRDLPHDELARLQCRPEATRFAADMV